MRRRIHEERKSGVRRVSLINLLIQFSISCQIFASIIMFYFHFQLIPYEIYRVYHYNGATSLSQS